jgi:hypothetical protein
MIEQTIRPLLTTPKSATKIGYSDQAVLLRRTLQEQTSLLKSAQDTNDSRSTSVLTERIQILMRLLLVLEQRTPDLLAVDQKIAFQQAKLEGGAALQESGGGVHVAMAGLVTAIGLLLFVAGVTGWGMYTLILGVVVIAVGCGTLWMMSIRRRDGADRAKKAKNELTPLVARRTELLVLDKPAVNDPAWPALHPGGIAQVVNVNDTTDGVFANAIRATAAERPAAQSQREPASAAGRQQS